MNECLPTFSRSRHSRLICINISRTKSINQGFCIRRFKMGVLEHVIEFINEAACDKDFAEDNWIGKGGRGSPRENRHLELQNVLN